jgi:uncharacterized SAM-binding protein YcdF (DUF218 family)
MHSALSLGSATHAPPPADYAVILGYALHRNGTCTRPLQSRVEVGVALFERGAARGLIFSGAHPGGGLRAVSEAGAMAAYAASLLPQPDSSPSPGVWIHEDRSTSTRTNALYSLRLILEQAQQQEQEQQQEQQQSLSIVVVTSPFHQLRAYLTFRRLLRDRGLLAGKPAAAREQQQQQQQYRLYVAPAPFAPHHGYGHAWLDAAADQADFWRELAALAYYWARGWL